MTLELSALPIAFLAGIVGVMSPCVWPLVPVVMASAANGGHSGPLFLVGGLILAFGVAGTFLTFLLVMSGLDPELFRYAAASLLIGMGVLLVADRLGDRFSYALSRITAGVDPTSRMRADSGPAQFGVGALLGVVWLPCVGPTLGVAIALAAIGGDLFRSFAVMLAYGMGTGGVLLLAGVVSGRILAGKKGVRFRGSSLGKKVLGWSVLVLGVLVLAGLDKRLEALAVNLLPAWVYGF